MNRSCAIILHITSLASPHGIGTMGEASLSFVDFLAAGNVKYWQLLPLNPVGYANSPYQSESVFAGSPLLIDLDTLVQENLLKQEQINQYSWGENADIVDFQLVSTQKEKLLRLAFLQADETLIENSKQFCKGTEWLDSYALYKAIKKKHNGEPFHQWEEEFKLFNEKILANKLNSDLQEEFDFHVFIQYLFFLQFARLRAYARERGVYLIGDLPIYPSADSADVWSNQKFFDLTKEKNPKNIAGVPPDMFSEDGQLWGNPLYAWDELKKENYSWWKLRITESLKLYDTIRIDHFRGFDSFWEVPFDSKTAKDGKWVTGPGMDLFNVLEQEMGRLPIIAEDLGILTDSVRKLLKDTEFPGMKVLQFAFTPYNESDYLPHNIIRNSVVYTGTHDNNTIKGWIDEQDNTTKEYIAKYLNCGELNTWAVIHSAWCSSAVLAVTTMQDLLELSSSARMNFPGTVTEENWSWRMTEGALTMELADKIRGLTTLCFRK